MTRELVFAPLVVDRSSSQSLGTRPAQVDAALTKLRAEVAAVPGLSLNEVTVPDGPDDSGTRAMQALSEALAQVPQDRVAGEVLLTDGRVHDIQAAPTLPAPLNVLLTGEKTDWDRRLVLREAPAFAILGEEVQLSLRIDDEGAAPSASGVSVDLSIALDDAAPQHFTVPVGQDLTLPVRLPHAGANVLQFSVPVEAGELTAANNSAVVEINGVRDRLRVLLVSGQPHAGARTWRNLLPSRRANSSSKRSRAST